MTGSNRLPLAFFLIALLLAGCATLSPSFEEPSLRVESIQLLNSNSLAPEFEIALAVNNPNRLPLNIDGMSYTLYLGGNQVVSGVANDLPSIVAYGETSVKVRATLSLLGGLKLLNDLTRNNPQNIEYKLVTQLDVGSFYPRITITKEGLFEF